MSFRLVQLRFRCGLDEFSLSFRDNFGKKSKVVAN